MVSRLAAVVAALGVIAVAALTPDADATSPGANGKIAVTADRSIPVFPFDIFTIEPDGSGFGPLVETTESNEIDPAWSPDGKRIAFSSGATIEVMDADGSHRTPVITRPGSVRSPSWSPTGDRIMFEERDETASSISIVGVNGSGYMPIRTIAVSEPEAEPEWSPVGNSVAFTAMTLEPDPEDPGEFRNVHELFTMAPDGSEQQRLTSIDGVRAPDWSPDGTRIAFVEFLEDDTAVATINAGGGPVTKLPNSSFTPADPPGWPAWSPDGTRIAFIHDADVYSQPLAGGPVENLTNGKLAAAAPHSPSDRAGSRRASTTRWSSRHGSRRTLSRDSRPSPFPICFPTAPTASIPAGQPMSSSLSSAPRSMATVMSATTSRDSAVCSTIGGFRVRPWRTSTGSPARSRTSGCRTFPRASGQPTTTSSTTHLVSAPRSRRCIKDGNQGRRRPEDLGHEFRAVHIQQQPTGPWCSRDQLGPGRVLHLRGAADTGLRDRPLPEPRDPGQARRDVTPSSSTSPCLTDHAVQGLPGPGLIAYGLSSNANLAARA